MTIKTILNAEQYDELADSLKEHYEERDDQYVLVSDATDKVKEFRNNNVELTEELKELKARQSVPDEELKKARSEALARNEKDLLSEGKIDELLAQRTDAMRQSYEEKLADLAGKHKEAEQTLDIHIIENQIRDAAIKAQARNDRAVEHIIRAVRPHVRRDGVNAVRVDAEGNTVMADDGKTPQGIIELVEEMRASDTFLFAESTGSGATGGGAPNGSASKQRIRRSEIGKYIEEVAEGKVEVVDG